VKPDGTTILNTAGAISVPTATNSIPGLVKPNGSTITNSAGVISVAYGTAANTAAQGNDARLVSWFTTGDAKITLKSSPDSG
jgi:hypothetical protein